MELSCSRPGFCNGILVYTLWAWEQSLFPQQRCLESIKTNKETTNTSSVYDIISDSIICKFNQAIA